MTVEGSVLPHAAMSSGNLREFLEWVAARPRTYADAMDAWRTSCPRLTVWEDAVDSGFITVEAGVGISKKDKPVVLTRRGIVWLRSADRPLATKGANGDRR